MVLYDTLRIEFGNCPPSCKLCEEACARAKGESRINTVRVPQVNYYGVITCAQCGEPKCQKVCPTGAIDKRQIDGVVFVNDQKCIGCGLCSLACPYGGIYLDNKTQTAFKCDLCDGKPKCVEVCPYHVLDFVKNSQIQDYLHDRDIYSPGTDLCPGCPAEIGVRLALRVLGKNTIICGVAGCVTSSMSGKDPVPGVLCSYCQCLLGNVASTMAGISRYYRHIGREVNVVAFVGDGATADIGFQALSGAVERQEHFIYICYDNEAYMNTGIQRSGTTPFGAWTNTTPAGGVFRGKSEQRKNVPLLMVVNKASYVATVNVAFLEDYARKLTKAMEVKDGVSYLHLYVPCQAGWRFPPDMSIKISRLAVETNFFPLWEAEKGKIRITQEITNPKPIHEFIKHIGKFSHLNEEEVEQLQKVVNSELDTLRVLQDVVL